MGRNHWNAQRWHRGYKNKRKRANPLWGPAIVVALALITGAVAAGHGAADGDSEMVGICHSTGDAASSFVYLVVARNGADHGHHMEHADDVLDVHSEAECPTSSDTPAEDDVLCDDETSSGSEDVDAGAQPNQTTPQNDTSNETSNETTEETGNETTNETGNETSNETDPVDPELEGLCDADAALSGNASRDGSWVRMEFRVESIGASEADDVRMDAALPDVGRAWRFSSAATGCLLEGLDLSCEFGDLPPNASRAVSVKAPRCEDDCGDDLESTASLEAYNDDNATNNAATVVLIVEDCPRGQPTPTGTSEPAPTTSAPPANNTSEPAPTTSAPPANNTSAPTPTTPADNETPSNQTNETEEPGNATQPNETEPAPAAGDASIAQRTEQDEDQVVFLIVVRSLGDATATDIRLLDTLPEVRRSWHLSGADAGDCTLDGRYLNCWFGDLEAGASRTITVKAYTDRMQCGQHLTNVPIVSSDGDENTRNNRATGSIEARSC